MVLKYQREERQKGGMREIEEENTGASIIWYLLT